MDEKHKNILWKLYYDDFNFDNANILTQKAKKIDKAISHDFVKNLKPVDKSQKTTGL
jgi:hypothetical protein